jgi:hypothetical protein
MTKDPQKQYEDTDKEDTKGGEATLSPRKWTIILWSVILCLTVGGSVATIFGVREVLEANASKDWPTTEGKIIDSSVEYEKRPRKPGESGPSKKKDYRAKISYEYWVDEVALTGSRIAYVKEMSFQLKADGLLGTQKSDTRSIERSIARVRAQGIVDRYPKGKIVSVFYKPDNPKLCVLEPGLGLQAFVAPVIGVFMIIVGGFIAWAVITGDRDKK